MTEEKLSKKEVQKIADLAQLKLTEKELDKYSEDLSEILDYIDKLDQINTQNEETTAHVSNLENVYREGDVPEAGSKKRAILARTLMKMPEATERGFVKVKSVFSNDK